MVSHKYKQLSHDITLIRHCVSFVWRSGLKHHRLLRLENRGFLDSFNPSMREKENVYMWLFFICLKKTTNTKCFEYYMSTYFKYFLSVHSPFTDLAVTCSENVVKSVFVIKFKMQWRFWFLRSERESEKGLTFQSCYILDKTNKIMYKCKINKDFELNIFVIVYKIHMSSAMNW